MKTNRPCTTSIRVGGDTLFYLTVKADNQTRGIVMAKKMNLSALHLGLLLFMLWGCSYSSAVNDGPSSDFSAPGNLLTTGTPTPTSAPSGTPVAAVITNSVGRSTYSGDGSNFTQAKFNPSGIAIDAVGNQYITDSINNAIRMFVVASGTYFGRSLTAGNIYTVVGNGFPARNGPVNGSSALGATLFSPNQIAVDLQGNLYTADGNGVVSFTLNTPGTYFGTTYSSGDVGNIYTIAGDYSLGQANFSGDGGPAINADFSEIDTLQVDALGNLFILDATDTTVRMVVNAAGTYYGTTYSSATLGNVYVVAGIEGDDDYVDGGQGVAAIGYSAGIALDSAGNIYISDRENLAIRMVFNAAGTYFGTTFGSGSIGSMITVAGGTSPIVSGTIHSPGVITVDSSGNIYEAYRNAGAEYINLILNAAGTYLGTTYGAGAIGTFVKIAGNSVTAAHAGDGGADLSANIPYNLAAMALAQNGSLYLVQSASFTYSGEIRKLDSSGNIYNYAGGFLRYSGDGAVASNSVLYTPTYLTFDSAGNLYFVDQDGQDLRMVPKVSGTYFGIAMTAGNIYSVAGSGSAYGSNAWSTAGCAATDTQVQPYGIVIDSYGNLFMESGNDVLLLANTTGTFYGISTTAGYIYAFAGQQYTASYTGDGGLATAATLYQVEGLAIDVLNNLYISDNYNNVIRMIPALSGTYYGIVMTAGNIYTIAGNNIQGYSGDNGPALSSEISSPGSIQVDAVGNFTFTDTGNNAIRMVPAVSGTYYGISMTAGNIYSIAGNGTFGFSVDGTAGTAAELQTATTHVIDSLGNIYFAENEANLVRMLPQVSGTYLGVTMTAGNIYTVAGMLEDGYAMDGNAGIGGVATSALLNAPFGVALNPSGDLYFSDENNDVIDKVSNH
jgi:hypothetical protein